MVAHKRLIHKKRNGEYILSLEVVEVVLVQCNLVDGQYQQKSGILSTFNPNKSYAYLLNVESSNLVFLKSLTLSLAIYHNIYRPKCYITENRTKNEFLFAY